MTATVLVQLAVNDVEAGLSPAVNEAFEHVEFGLDKRPRTGAAARRSHS